MAVNSVELSINFRGNISGANDQGAPIWVPSVSKIIQLAGGTLADQADIVWTDTRTVASAANDDLDLSGVLQTPFGATVALVKVVGIMIVAARANTTNLTIGGGTNSWTGMWLAAGDGIVIPPGGVFVNAAPALAGLGSVVAGTGDILRIANGSGAAATYDIAIVGRSA